LPRRKLKAPPQITPKKGSARAVKEVKANGASYKQEAPSLPSVLSKDFCRFFLERMKSQ
jgi:hypothetical protein